MSSDVNPPFAIGIIWSTSSRRLGSALVKLPHIQNARAEKTNIELDAEGKPKRKDKKEFRSEGKDVE